MRISDWGSDVCSSDLGQLPLPGFVSHSAHPKRKRPVGILLSGVRPVGGRADGSNHVFPRDPSVAFKPMPRSRSCEPELLKPPDHRFDGNAEVVSNQNDVAALQPVGASRQFFEFSFDRLSRSDKAAPEGVCVALVSRNETLVHLKHLRSPARSIEMA